MREYSNSARSATLSRESRRCYLKNAANRVQVLRGTRSRSLESSLGLASWS